MAWGCIVVLGNSNQKGNETSHESDTQEIASPARQKGTATINEDSPTDLGAALNDVLHTIMEAIASGTRRIKYLEPWFVDGRGNKGSLEEAMDTCLTNGSTNRIIGYVPWKAMEVHYRTIQCKQDFLRDSRQKIEEPWKMVHTIQSSDNPRMTLHDMYAPLFGLH